ncbi:hypothetical protein Tco_0340340 [Tanacetum coccineum]
MLEETMKGIPKGTLHIINHYTDAKDIGDNVMKRFGRFELTDDDRGITNYTMNLIASVKSKERHSCYYVRFFEALLTTFEKHQDDHVQNAAYSKFVNNMLPEWSRFITEVKLNRGLKESNFDQLYAYLKQHEVHANENRMMMERFIQPTNDPLALVSNASDLKSNTII